MCHAAFPFQWKQHGLTFQVQLHAVGDCGGYVYSVLQEFLGFFFTCLFIFFSSEGNEQLWVQITNFICSFCLHCLQKASFLFSPHTLDNLNKESLHERREQWQSCFKQSLVKTKEVWLMFMYWKLPPCKGAEWRCQPEKAHHGDGDGMGDAE